MPDPSHTLSSRHAEIRFNGQGFVIVDLSTNGVYVNSTDAPIGRGNSAVLVNGDQIYVGTYVLTVEILRQAKAPEAKASMPASPLPPLAPPTSENPAAFSFPPSTPTGAYRGTLDPLAALDGDDALQQTDNPFGDLGIGNRDRDKTDAGLRSALGLSSPPSRSSPLPPPSAFSPFAPAPSFAPTPAPAVSASAPVIPMDFNPVAPPPPAPKPFIPPAPPVVARAPEPAPAVIPPDFLEELSQLIPQLGGSGAPNAPAVPVPQPLAPPPAAPANVEDPEDMVTLLRMRAKSKAPSAPSAVPIPAQPAFVQPAPVSPTPMQAPPLQAPPLQAPPLQPPPVQPPPPRPAAAPAAPPLAPPLQAPPLQAPPPQPIPPMALAPEPVRQGPSTENTEAAFWALLGADGANLSPAERARLLGEAAGLIRGVVEGMIALQATRRSLKGELHLEPTELMREANPFKTAISAQDALTQVFRARMNAGAVARSVFEEMRIHEMASLDAMQATISRLMQRISPAAISFELEGEGPSEGVFARKTDKARLWDRYLVMHERLVDALDVLSPELVGQEFARAYAQHAETLRREDS